MIFQILYFCKVGLFDKIITTLSSVWIDLTAYHTAEIKVITAIQHVASLPLLSDSLPVSCHAREGRSYVDADSGQQLREECPTEIMKQILGYFDNINYYLTLSPTKG